MYEVDKHLEGVKEQIYLVAGGLKSSLTSSSKLTPPNCSFEDTSTLKKAVASMLAKLITCFCLEGRIHSASTLQCPLIYSSVHGLSVPRSEDDLESRRIPFLLVQVAVLALIGLFDSFPETFPSVRNR